MNYAFDSRLGKQLYQLLPEVYRSRDKNDAQTSDQHLAKYLDAHGHLLDLIHGTLQQQLRDTLPESSQDWLLPYFAQLLAVNIVSPESAGKHAEVANAVSWRQRKGTLKCAEEIAESIGQMEVEIQEGWKRVAMTPRVDMPMLPVGVWDDSIEIDMLVPSEATRHPSLPTAMVDLRRPSRSVEALASNPAAQKSSFGGIRQNWRQLNRHGVPCFPGSYEDVSRRTVDIRTASAVNGHYHHRRLLAYAPPPHGLIQFEAITLSWDERLDSLYEHLIEEREENGVQIIRNKTDRVLEISNDVSLAVGLYRIEGIHFQGELAVAAGGNLELLRVQATRVSVPTFSIDEAVLVAGDCLFEELSCGGLVELDSCTLLGVAYLTSVQALDCIFNAFDGINISGVIEYSRIPDDAPFDADNMIIEDCTPALPIYFSGQETLAAKAVLTPNTPQSIYRGASNGGEMGYFHHGRQGKPVRINGNFTGTKALSLPANSSYALADLIFEGDLLVETGQLELIRSAANSITLKSAAALDDSGLVIPLLNARDCLFDEVFVINGLLRLEYCTVMKAAGCQQLQASDCLFIGTISDGAEGEPEAGCLRYSRIPPGFDSSSLNAKTGFNGTNTSESPEFAQYDFCDPNQYREAEYGEAGYAVLALTCSDAIRFGAEDGGELGVGHHNYYSLRAEAVLDKMREFLPVGIEPVLIQDRRLLKVPPEIKNSLEGESS